MAVVAKLPVNSSARQEALSASGLGRWSLFSNQSGGRSGASGGSSGIGSSYDALFRQLQEIQTSNNAWSAAQAQKQMDFQKQSAQEAMKFNHDEAELSRNWQEYMSDTAHQREVKDLMLAGLNPVLSATGGSGAPVTSGATASGYTSQGAKGDTDTSLSGALVALFSSLLQSQTTLASQAMSAQTALAQADKYAEASKFSAVTAAHSSKYVADTNRLSSYEVASIHAGATLSAANISATASRISALIYRDSAVGTATINATTSRLNAALQATTSRYGVDVNAMTQKQLAAFNADLQKQLQMRGFNQEIYLQKDRQSHETKLMIGGKMMDFATDGIKGINSSLSSLAKMIPFMGLG